MDLTKEVRGNEPPAETKHKVAKERRREKEREGGRGNPKKEMESEEGVRPVERRTRRRGRNKKGNDERTEGEREGWKGEGVGCGRAFEASRRA